MQPNYQQPINMDPTPVAPTQGSAKNNTALIVILAIVAVAGLGFGGYELWQNLNIKGTSTDNCLIMDEGEEVQDKDENATIEMKSVAENLIAPYVKSLGYNRNVFDQELDENVKAIIAYLNTTSDDVRQEDDYARWTYASARTVQDTYAQLFGTETTLEAKDYSIGIQQECVVSLVAIDNNGGFKSRELGCGGAGGELMTVVKDSYMEGEKMVVEVYNVRGIWCDTDSTTKFCFETSGVEYTSKVDDYGKPTAEYISENAPDTPAYKMIFEQDNSRYVLTDITKLEA